MIPVLFSENSTTFETNGVGGLSDVLSCIVTEARNGQYELEMVYPVEGRRFSDIAINSLIVVIPFDGGTRQAFRVYKISKPINGKVTINAWHISYQLSNIPCMPFSVTASTTACSETFQKLKENAVEACPFTFETDVVTGASYDQKTPASIRSRLGGVDGSILDQFGGEYEWDNWTVKFHKQRGSDNNVTLRYGKNITDITQEENIASTVTGVVPFWIDPEGENLVTLPEKAIYSTYADHYPFRLTVPYDLSARYQEQPTEAAIRAAAKSYVNKTGLGIPAVSIEVSFVALWQTEEYKDIAPLQRVKLCDTVTIEFEKLGISTKAKVVETVYDVLAERYKSIQIGNIRSSLAETLNDQNIMTLRTIDGKTLQLQGLIDNATAWMTGSNGYVMAVRHDDGSWAELLFLDTNDATDAKNVLRINENGIGFSSNGINGPYSQAWTLDGNLLVGGTGAPSFTVYDSSNHIIFQATKDGIIWNATNSSMDIDGIITLNGAVLTGEGLKSQGTNGWVQIKNGELHGGYGELGSNDVKIDFANIIDGNSGWIGLQANGVALSVNKLGITDYRNGNTVHIGNTGTFPYVVSYNPNTGEVVTSSMSFINGIKV